MLLILHHCVSQIIAKTELFIYKKKTNYNKAFGILIIKINWKKNKSANVHETEK